MLLIKSYNYQQIFLKYYKINMYYTHEMQNDNKFYNNI